MSIEVSKIIRNSVEYKKCVFNGIEWEVPSGPSIEMVDLGLPSGTLWAANNIGAEPGSTPESYYGDYYAWGETETKSNYSIDTYKFGVSSPFSKYDEDGKTVLEATDDVVTTIYGSNYHIPTYDECQELINGTDNEWVTDYNGISGLNGHKFMKKSDHSVFIFIPAAGFFDGSSCEPASFCQVWTSSICSFSHSVAWDFVLYSSNTILSSGCRYYGSSVRAVCSAN